MQHNQKNRLLPRPPDEERCMWPALSIKNGGTKTKETGGRHGNQLKREISACGAETGKQEEKKHRKPLVVGEELRHSTRDPKNPFAGPFRSWFGVGEDYFKN